jgi:hypothetical protein
MPDYGLMVGWGNAVRGREQQAAKVFGEAVELYTQLQQQGKISGFEAFFLEPHGGDLAGFFLLRGEQDALAHVRTSDEFTTLNTRAGMIVENFGVVGAQTGARVEQLMGEFLEAAKELG